MAVLRKELCVLKFREMHTKYEKKYFFFKFFINQVGEKCYFNYFNSSIL